MVKYNIISTGSDGNATILEEFVLIDCGVPYKALEPYVPKLKLVLLTHIHSDHFQKRTIKRLAEERPTLRFGCCRWLAPLLAAGVPERQIDVLEPRTMYGYGLCNVIPFMLTHNVPNCGYKVHFEAYRKAVQFYFPNAEISFSMNINLTGTPPTEEEMRAPATIKPENATPNIPKPQESAKEKPDQKKPKPEKKPAKKKEKQSEDSMQLSLDGWF